MKTKIYLISVDGIEYLCRGLPDMQCNQVNSQLFRDIGRPELANSPRTVFNLFSKKYRRLNGGKPLDRRTVCYKLLKRERAFFTVSVLFDPWRVTAEDRVKILKEALGWYKNQTSKGRVPGMCNAIEHALATLKPKLYEANADKAFSYMQKYIPDFSPEFFGLGLNFDDGYWWPSENYKIRIEAFNKLIKRYEN